MNTRIAISRYDFTNDLVDCESKSWEEVIALLKSQNTDISNPLIRNVTISFQKDGLFLDDVKRLKRVIFASILTFFLLAVGLSASYSFFVQLQGNTCLVKQ